MMRANAKFKKLAMGTFVITTALLTAVAVYAATVVVTLDNLQGWQTVTTVSSESTASISFVNGPGTPPLGTGSVQFSIGSSPGSYAELRNLNYAGTLLSQLTALSYSTYVQQDSSGGNAPYLMLHVDAYNTGTASHILIFEPVYQNSAFGCSNQPVIAPNTWQTWDALNGCWFGVGPTTGNGIFAGPGVHVKPLSNFITANPNATIVNIYEPGGIRIFSDWDNFIGNVDNVTIGVNGNTNTFDFEPTQVTASSVSVTGRVMSGRRGISNARVFLTNQNGEIKTALTNSLGYYRFEDVQVGGTYILNVSSKRYNFQPRVITVNEEMTDVNLASEQ